MRFLPLNKSPSDRRKGIIGKISRYNPIIVIVLLIFTLVVGIYIGRESKSEVFSVAPAVFITDRNNCIVSKGKMLCMESNKVTVNF